MNFSSGGGFSNIYPIPDYQAKFVAKFFDEHNPPYPYYSALSNDTDNIQTLPDIGALAGSTGGIYNRIGRGIPDVAAVGDNIAVSKFFYFSYFPNHSDNSNKNSRYTTATTLVSAVAHPPVHRFSPRSLIELMKRESM